MSKCLEKKLYFLLEFCPPSFWFGKNKDKMVEINNLFFYISSEIMLENKYEEIMLENTVFVAKIKKNKTNY
jgi:hypothetical protein